jgi:molybdate transport system ATP-binding protein
MSGGFAFALHGRLGALELSLEAECPPGVTVVVGSNGAGKSTLLRALAGAELELRGRIRLGDRVLLDTAAGVSVPPEARRLGWVPQSQALFSHLDALDNVAFGVRAPGPDGAGVLDALGARLGGGARAARRAEARRVLAGFEAEAVAGRRPAGLSGGERQRVALARAFALRPEGLLLDEPLSALDVGARRRMRSLLAERLAESAAPALVVTHARRDIEALAAWVLVVEAGRVVARGTPAELARNPPTPLVAELLGA